MGSTGDNDEEVTDELKEKSGAKKDGRTPDETADNLAQPGSSATGSGTSMGTIDVESIDTTGGTTDADVTDGANQ